MSTLLNNYPRIEAAIKAYQQGLPVLLSDDNDRENEADLVAAAENITPQTMAMMIRDGSGIVCLCLTEQTVQQLELAPMVRDNQSRYQTAFTVSVEAKEGVSTGVSANDRVTTIKSVLASVNNPVKQFVSPGHVFPLCARKGGILERRGHTEGSIEIARLAGLKPKAVLCELTNPDGSMAKGDQVTAFAKQHNIPMLTIEELAQYLLVKQAMQNTQQVAEAQAIQA